MTEWVTVAPLVDDDLNQTFWHQPEFKVGDRVRVRLSGECRIEGWVGSVKDPNKREWRVCHYDFEDGLVGTIVECPFIARDGFCIEDTHAIVLRFDHAPPIPQTGINAKHGHYAACELEPLE